MQKFLGLAEINLIGTCTYRFGEKFAHRYCFNSARVIQHGGEQMLQTDRFYVWAEAADTAYKIAVNHVYRAPNQRYHGAVDPGEGGSLYNCEIDEQHKEVQIYNEKDWRQLIYSGNFEDRNEFYLGG
jgi:hypothetical protein